MKASPRLTKTFCSDVDVFYGYLFEGIKGYFELRFRLAQLPLFIKNPVYRYKRGDLHGNQVGTIQ